MQLLQSQRDLKKTLPRGYCHPIEDIQKIGQNRVVAFSNQFLERLQQMHNCCQTAADKIFSATLFSFHCSQNISVGTKWSPY